LKQNNKLNKFDVTKLKVLNISIIKYSNNSFIELIIFDENIINFLIFYFNFIYISFHLL